ncbi:MAG: hypothetical protein K9G67_15015 [Bacteroidales bacterium]|nr:hypothetical protein [Bacteroidales bacterium]MCF8351211.1 hypothetical protein [Bacteroidales bacterium]MCF8377664.1 hypothetical protein [Bacteroidales bacterium]MCF8402064.1 hypothetical protein [Bacteroidales bacterium]
MRFSLLLIFVVSFAFGVSGQVQVMLPTDVTLLQKDFYVVRVFDAREQPDSHFGYYTDVNEKIREKIIIYKGLIPETEHYFQNLLPHQAGKYPIIIMIEKLKMDAMVKDSGKFVTAMVGMGFYTEKGGALVELYKTSAFNKVQVYEVNKGLTYNLAEVLNRSIEDFSKTDWKQHPIFMAIEEEEETIRDTTKNTTDYIDRTSMNQYRPNRILFTEFQFKIEGGYSLWLEDIPEDYSDDEKDLMEELHPGSGFFLDAVYYPDKDYGFGISFGNMNHKAETSQLKYYDDDDSLLGIYPFEMNTKFRMVGGVLYGRSMLIHDLLLLTGNISPSYIWMTESQFGVFGNSETKGSGFALQGGVSLDFLAGDNMTIGLSVSYLTSKLDEVEYQGIRVPWEYDLDHITFGVNLKIFR